MHSGVNKEERAKEGVGLLIKSKYKDAIKTCQYINSRILQILMETHDTKIHIISVYAPEACKPLQEREIFFNQLQQAVDKIPSNEMLILLGDFNSRIGNNIIPGVKQRFNEDYLNSNGELLIELCTQQELRISNTFFPHKNQQKITFRNSRGQYSTIDYIITNRKIHPTQVIDVRTLNSANINTDHNLLIAKISIKLKLKNFLIKSPQEPKILIEGLCNESTKQLYQKRLNEKIQARTRQYDQNVNQLWTTLKENITEAAKEALGMRFPKSKIKPNKTPWFRQEVKTKCKEKRTAYLQYRNNPTTETLQNFIKIRNETKSLVRKVKEEY